ncbi:MAG: hypothetical protein LBP59_03770, partial [Planctomycetaceae bacterium]|nr:hypothetical protein [Planctomycetaceae bacterium]
MRLYSTAYDRFFYLNRFIGCLSETCRRDARDPLVSSALQDRRYFAWCFFRFAGGTPVSQDRGRLACMRLYSTADERCFDLNRFIGCLSATCRRDARDPLVSSALQDRRHFAWCFFRFAGGTPASQDRGRLACMRLYSTADERCFDLNCFIGCL